MPMLSGINKITSEMQWGTDAVSPRITDIILNMMELKEMQRTTLT